MQKTNRDGELTLRITSFSGEIGEEIVFVDSSQIGLCSPDSLSKCVNKEQCNAIGGGWFSDNTCQDIPENTVVSAGDRIWMDRNLGASRVATSSTDSEAYGDLYQWGRDTDGHERRTSSTTSMTSSNDNPGHDNFIKEDDFPDDWRNPQNNNLWQGESGINNPCPPGFRLPTDAEFNNEKMSWDSHGPAGAFASPLKLVAAGFRYRNNGAINMASSQGYYWSGSTDGIYSNKLYFYGNTTSYGIGVRADGFSVRCIKN